MDSVGIEVIETDLGERIQQLSLLPSADDRKRPRA
jgi:L-lactate utilization protein LutB